MNSEKLAQFEKERTGLIRAIENIQLALGNDVEKPNLSVTVDSRSVIATLSSPP